ncbi:hypothetical protein SDRG_10800 [Saprolegnia diclina VS20]|uniref:COMM domain-containing protein n=1 Tax=Saprolegnia diclina (strain VS20) TaxID=1156394 RepID=T0QDI4_SAPDV|nr:hypothetical protein SDRG_10800 [Saprolegnia diclina VS20]EQC31635.1 hypothetical protein SDRG_10800 [Saprolegnia diclina VS20]|eukprot:XP_008615034.1 hypothetical protein SDRG_10800 [Saprolegnia diclina VS20]
MSSATLVSLDARSVEALPLLSAFSLEKLPLLAQRLLRAPAATAFTKDEEHQLAEIGGMTHDQVGAFLALLQSLFQAAGRRRLAPSVFAQELQRLSIASTTSDVLANVWSHEQAAYEATLIEASSHHAPTLIEAQWRLHVTMADSASKGMATPSALFHMQESNGVAWDMEMDHTELHAFLVQLDAIQAQLDALAAAP